MRRVEALEQALRALQQDEPPATAESGGADAADAEETASVLGILD
jgi:hypothetical protein